jgi:hypothetical protein
MAVFLGRKDLRLWIKLGAIQHENLFISTIQPTNKSSSNECDKFFN